MTGLPSRPPSPSQTPDPEVTPIPSAPVEIYGRPIVPGLDSYIVPDGWGTRAALGGRLVDGGEFSRFRITSARYPYLTVPVAVTVTGRTLQRYAGELWVRVALEFLQDGEPSTFSAGWLCVD